MISHLLSLGKEINQKSYMQRSDLYEDYRVLSIVRGELKNYSDGKAFLGDVLDNLQYILMERAEVQEEQ
jgi:hypothetical protein